MKKTLLVILVLCSCAVVCDAQRRNRNEGSLRVRLKKAEPSIYITFERAGEHPPLETGESNQRVWLRLHNNTRWAIILEMKGVPSSAYGDAGLFYEVLSDEKVVIDARCHSCSVNKLPSGKSLLFSVPREYLDKGLALRVSFNYEWENQDDAFAGVEPRHYVYFYASRLPQNIQQNGR